MPLIKCHECGSDVSTEAKTCPKCGAKVKKPTSRAAKLIVVLLGVGIFGGIISNETSTTATATETPAEKALKEAKATQYAAAAGLSIKLRESMRDPDSMKIETLRINDDSSVVCAQYRARNGFGGMNRGFVVVTKYKSSQSTADWNKHCTKPMTDMLWAAK